jgi:hypothetical protein
VRCEFFKRLVSIARNSCALPEKLRVVAVRSASLSVSFLVVDLGLPNLFQEGRQSVFTQDSLDAGYNLFGVYCTGVKHQSPYTSIFFGSIQVTLCLWGTIVSNHVGC